MNKIQYWITASEKDWVAAGHLQEKKDYDYALFFDHLTLEKLLKAYYFTIFVQNPPMIHHLIYWLKIRAGSLR